MSAKLDQEMRHQKAELDDLRALLTNKEDDIASLKNTIIEQENIILHLRNSKEEDDSVSRQPKLVSFDRNTSIDSVNADMRQTLAMTINNPLKRSAFNYFFKGHSKKIDEETLKLLLDDNEKLKSKCDSLKALCDEYYKDDLMAEDRAKKWEAEINNTIKNHKSECARMEEAFKVKEQALEHYTKEKNQEFESFR